MDIYVFDKDYTPLGIVDSPVSLSYINRFKVKGEFLMVIPLTSYHSELLTKDNYLLFDESLGIAGVIESLKSTTDEKGKKQIEVKGGLCDTYLYRRIIWGLYVKSGTSIEIVEDLVKTQVVSPIDLKRAISDMEIISEVSSKGSSMQYQNTGGVVGTAIEDICSSDDFGFSVSFDYLAKKMYFKVIKGEDRTEGQNLVPQCIFSREYENILSSNYEENYLTYKNVALVAGEGEGDQRKYVTSGASEVTGKQRCEVFVDARDLQSNNDGTTIPVDEYKAMLDQRGKEQLDTLKPIVNFDCVINTLGNIKYGVDYFLGDKVTIKDSILGVSIDAEISEVETVYDSSGKTIYITFGYNQLTLAKAIKAKVVS